MKASKQKGLMGRRSFFAGIHQKTGQKQMPIRVTKLIADSYLKILKVRDR
jgi:hypothetical protein